MFVSNSNDTADRSQRPAGISKLNNCMMKAFHLPQAPHNVGEKVVFVICSRFFLT
jgi:hypothetical protein